MRRLERGLRVVGAGLSFAWFGGSAVWLVGVVFPVLRLLPGDRQAHEDRAQRAVHRVFRTFVSFMRALHLIEVRVEGAERLHGGGRVVVANHPTLLDVVLLVSLLPQADCVVKRAIFGNPFMRGVARATGYLPNDRGEAVVEACAERLRRGRTVLLFPEGTRSPRDGLGRFRRGAAHAALRSGCPLLPVTLRCEPPALLRGQPWYDVPDATIRYSLDVGEPIDAREFAGASRGAAARRLTGVLREHFARSLESSSASRATRRESGTIESAGRRVGKPADSDVRARNLL